MKLYAIVPIMLVAVCAFRAPIATFHAPLAAKTSASANGGWVKLFDGTTTKGWHTYGQSSAGSAWKADDSTLHLIGSSTSGRGDIVTDSEYENFDLKLEWKVQKGTNSGIMFDVHEDPSKYKNTYETGPEMQVLDNDGHPDGKIFKHRAGDLYDLIPCKVQTVKPVGEWNQVEIRLKNGKLKFTLNGVDVVETKMWDDNWNKMVAGSKFAQMPGFATFHKGHISLQDHGGNEDVWFKNIMIKQL
jgi:hypothetical protein